MQNDYCLVANAACALLFLLALFSPPAHAVIQTTTPVTYWTWGGGVQYPTQYSTGDAACAAFALLYGPNVTGTYAVGTSGCYFSGQGFNLAPGISQHISCPIDTANPWIYSASTNMCERPSDCPAHARGIPCVCDTGYKMDAAGTSCVQEQYTITLQGGSSMQPATLLPFNATVKDQNGVVKPNKQVTISVNVEDGTGGHIHTENRPNGTFTCASSQGASSAICTLTTDYNGQTPFEFVATPVSGTHTITATCAGCNNTATAQVNVKVDGLIPLPAAPQLYALQDSAGTVIGVVAGRHTANHYLTSTAIGKLKELTNIYATVNPGTKLYLNDASLEWGGLFDVGNNTPWSSPHSTHDKGRSLDIRAANSGPNNEGAVPATVFKKFISEASKGKFRMGLHCKNSSDTNYCLGQPNNRHFHVDF